MGGVVSLGTMMYAYKKKYTGVFKTSYVTLWLTLGPGIMMAVIPSSEEVEQRLKAKGWSAEKLEEQRQASKMAYEQLRQQVREGSKPNTE